MPFLRPRLFSGGYRAALVPVSLVVFFFSSGVAAGALALHFRSARQLAELHQYLDGFLATARLSSPRGLLFVWDTGAWLDALAAQLSSLALVWVLGLTVVGIPFLLFAVAGRGFILGFTVGFLVREHLERGLLLTIAAVLPQNLCYLPALLAAAVLACYFSLSLARGELPSSVFRGVAAYTLLFFFLLLLALAGTLVEAYLVPGFVRAVVLFVPLGTT